MKVIPLICEVERHGYSPHMQQLLVSLDSLRRRGLVIVKHPSEGVHVSSSAENSTIVDAVSVRVASLKILFEFRDSSELCADALSSYDYYFKRSYRIGGYDVGSSQCMVLPLGLNYCLEPEKISRWFLKGVYRREGLSASAKALVKSLDKRQRFVFRSTPSAMYCKPRTTVDDVSVLFLTRLWDPSSDEKFELSESEAVDRMLLNEFRIACAEEIRRCFPGRATTGIQSSAYAKKTVPQSLLASPALTDKKSYMTKVMPMHDILVATKGLHGSTGWRLAEAVAFSKAVVTETVLHEFPGSFLEGKNYLASDTVEGICEQIDRLLTNENNITQMMENNYAYYKEYLDPEVFAYNVFVNIPELVGQLRPISVAQRR